MKNAEQPTIAMYELKDTNNLSEETTQFIREYVNKKLMPDKEKAKYISTLFLFLEESQHFLIKEVCLTKEGAELVCDKWIDSSANVTGINAEAFSMQRKFYIFYEELFYSAVLQFLIKCRNKPVKHIQPSTIFRECSAELSFLEYYAFLLMHEKESANIENIHRYLENNSLSFQTLEQFRFIKKDEAISTHYYFCHPSFLHFFCARFLISSCYLQANISNERYPYSHEIEKTVANTSIDEYLQLKSQDKSYYPVWNWLKILSDFDDDKQRLSFRSFIPDGVKQECFIAKKILNESIKALNECAKSHSQFSFLRQEKNTLIIQYNKSDYDVWGHVRQFRPLYEKFNNWLVINQLNDKVQIVFDNHEVIQLKIIAAPEIIETILQWFEQITEHFASLFDGRGRPPTFFKLSTSSNESKENKFLECRLQ
ncbi:TPA: hypothetical protein RJD83_002631 [Legionella pneumophila]|nr:hypothetical protein [Legionella pneumophila]